MTPADKRMLEQLDRWLTSVELHLKYVDLDEASYRQVQAWPDHERPARWILELAQQKILQLKTLCKAHTASQDESFSEALELMGFLTNLVGAQNIKRFIPAADPNRKQAETPEAVNQIAAQASAKAHQDVNSTREMPTLKAAAPAAGPDSTRELPKLKIAAKKTAPARATDPVRRSAKPSPPVPAASGTQAEQQVVADAVRLLKWGKEWHELTELIARMAERPAATDIRRILRTHKTLIERQVG